MRSSAYCPKYGFGAFGIFPLLLKRRLVWIINTIFAASLASWYIQNSDALCWWIYLFLQSIFWRLWCFGIEIWLRKFVIWSQVYAFMLYVIWVLEPWVSFLLTHDNMIYKALFTNFRFAVITIFWPVRIFPKESMIINFFCFFLLLSISIL